jgi:hypothetical protein
MAARTTTKQAEALTVEIVGAMDEADRKKALTTERAAIKAAQKAGTPLTDTPVSDWYAAQEAEASGKAKAKEPAKPRGVTAPTGMVNFFVDDRLVAETQHKLSYMAGYTRTKTEPRLSTKDLIEAVCKATGKTPAELMQSEWEFTLPQSGRVIRTELIPGREAPAAPAAAEAPVEAPAAPAAKPRRSRAKAATAAA